MFRPSSEVEIFHTHTPFDVMGEWMQRSTHSKHYSKRKFRRDLRSANTHPAVLLCCQTASGRVKEKDIENTAKKEKERDIRRLEEELKTMEKKLADEVDQHKNTQEQLEIRKQECKKRSVLSLEMEDYEVITNILFHSPLYLHKFV